LDTLLSGAASRTFEVAQEHARLGDEEFLSIHGPEFGTASVSIIMLGVLGSSVHRGRRVGALREPAGVHEASIDEDGSWTTPISKS
jgi:hypothetical protein